MLFNSELEPRTDQPVRDPSVVVEPLTQVRNVHSVPLCHRQVLEQVAHVPIEVPLKLVDHLRVIVLEDVSPNHNSLLLLPLFAPNTRIGVGIDYLVVLGFFIVIRQTILVCVVLRRHIHEEPNDHPAEVVRAHVNLSDCLE